MDRTPPLREFLCSDTDTREILREAREIVLVGDDAAAVSTRDTLRTFGYRIRISQSVELEPDEIETDVIVLLRELAAEEAATLFASARNRGARVLWLGRGVGDPALALAAYRAGFAVIFHRDPAEEYRMHFDDVELGYVAPGSR